MNRLRITLNDRKRFVISAALATVLVLLAAGANALPPPTGRCVRTTNIRCTADYATIGLAVAAASTGDTIFVGPGTYNESVTIGVDYLSVFGAKAGKDPREGQDDPSKESIVVAPAGNSAFKIIGSFDIINGFVVKSVTAVSSSPPLPAGVAILGGLGTEIIYCNIQNNSAGVVLDGASQSFIERNRITNNNAGTASNSGYGIFLSGAVSSVIADNEFCGNKTAAIYDNASTSTTITNNTSEKGGAFVIFKSTAFGRLSHNQGKKFGDGGAFSGAGDAAVGVGPGNAYLEISGNEFEKGETPISNGIAVTTFFGTSPVNAVVSITNNKVSEFPGIGIAVEAGTGPVGMLVSSSIAGNEVYDNGLDGIFIEGATSSGNSGISVVDNEAEGNHVFDCRDTSTGPGTLLTANYWSNNTGNLSYPPGPPPLCAPGRRHDHD